MSRDLDNRLTDDDVTRTIACAGPPWCELVGIAAVRAAMAGCPYCTRRRYDEFGHQLSERGPGHA